MAVPSHENPIRLIVSVTDSTLSGVLSLGLSLQAEARKEGGDGRVFRLPESVQIDLEGVSQNHVDLLLSAFGVSVMKNKDGLEFAKSVRTTELPQTVISGEFFREKLTKKFLLGLPQGVWLVSNIIPRWTAHLSDRADRQRIWEQAIEHGANHRLVSVVWSEHDANIIIGASPFLPPYDLKDRRP